MYRGAVPVIAAYRGTVPLTKIMRGIIEAWTGSLFERDFAVTSTPDALKSFARTTSATCRDYLGNIVSCPVNLIRLEGARLVNHSNSTDYGAGVLGYEWRTDKPDGSPITTPIYLLIEPAATNYLQKPANYSTVDTLWSALSVSPFNAARLTEAATTNFHTSYSSSVTLPVGGWRVASAYFKKSTRRYACLQVGANSGGSRYTVVADLDTGTIETTYTYGSWTAVDGGVEIHGDKVFVWVSGNHPSVISQGAVATWDGISTTISYAYPVFLGSTSESVDVLHMQLENGRYPTSRIITDSSSLSRTADSPVNYSPVADLEGKTATIGYYNSALALQSATEVVGAGPFTAYNSGTDTLGVGIAANGPQRIESITVQEPVFYDNIFNNPNFDTNATGWGLGAGWAWSAGRLVKTGTNTSPVSQGIHMTPGTWEVEFDCVVTAGGIYPVFTNGESISFPPKSTTGKYVHRFTYTGDMVATFYLYCDSFTGELDSFKMRRFSL